MGLTGTKGGSGVWQRIISEMPPHRVYIEPFWGRGTIARAKKPAEYTIGCDLDDDAIQDGRGYALMFQTCGIRWLCDYFQLFLPFYRRANFTFGGVPWDEHFVYLDPPYFGCSGHYKHELTIDQHVLLCEMFMQLPCKAAMSGYWNELYDKLACRHIRIPTVNRAGQRVDEIVWLNYGPLRRYHDVRFVGKDRRERERIQRRVRNWKASLKRMQPAERQAILEACQSVS